ncbi:hypothetical protein OG618_37370 (plasmid) [Kitasatospora sp. NBC_01246]|uniref:hypothetical protein n=1 Tax=Kitasatospora sp. NBC_01246 TaxID=2903570 RepID=UPI002E3679A9|nr:hypothetical protein [Kitasatospora sp. NBC_01246]
MPTSTTPELSATLRHDLAAAATLLSDRGIWRGDSGFAAPDGYPDPWEPLAFAGAGPAGALDPMAALWLATHPGPLPQTFTTATPQACADACDAILDDPRTGPAVRALANSLADAHQAIPDPIERLAYWLDSASDLEVIGRLLRLAETPAP